MPSLCSASPWRDVGYVYLWLPAALFFLIIVVLIIFNIANIDSAYTVYTVMVIIFIAPSVMMYQRFRDIRADCKKDCLAESKK